MTQTVESSAPDASGTETADSPAEQTDADESLTDSPRSRWEWLSSVVAFLVVTSSVALVGLVAYQPAPVAWPGGVMGAAYVAIVLAATTYAIGEDVVGILTKLR
ncbi:MAG: hypothetical protein ABEJ55_06665, partial [Halanaeroarchaeum sp.]